VSARPSNFVGGRSQINTTIAAGESAYTDYTDMYRHHYNSAEAWGISLSGGTELEVTVEFSHNATGTDASPRGAGPWYTRADYGGSIGIPRVVRRTARRARLRIRNVSASPVQAIGWIYYNNQPATPTIQRITAEFGDDYDAINTRQLNDPRLDEGRELALDRIPVLKFGANPTVGTSPEIVWPLSTTTYTFLQAAATLEVISDDAGDTAAGAGARSVTIVGLDASFNTVTETVTTNGTSASSATSASFLRIERAFAADVGSYTAPYNLGNLTIRVSGGGASVAYIAATEGKTQQAIYTVPAGFTFHIRQLSGSVETGKGARFRLYQRQNADDVTVPVTGRRLVREKAQTFDDQLATYIAIPEKTDLWFESSTLSGSTSAVTVGFDGVLTRNR
jgi:hypothetical protein